MKIQVLALALLGLVTASIAEDDGGFHTVREWRAVGLSPDTDQESVDDVFGTVGVSAKLTDEVRVRLVRCTSDPELRNLRYLQMEDEHPIEPRLKLGARLSELPKESSRPLVKLLADMDHYGDSTICGFVPGVAILIGPDEPEFVILCCFKCHDLHVIRRPTKQHPMPHVSRLGMSPELERAVFELSRASFPNDDELKTFTLAERVRSKTPLKSDLQPPKDPFSKNEAK